MLEINDELSILKFVVSKVFDNVYISCVLFGMFYCDCEKSKVFEGYFMILKDFFLLNLGMLLIFE